MDQFEQIWFFLNTNDYKTVNLYTFLQSLNLNQLAPSATHFTARTETTIDLVCTDVKVRSIEVNWISLGHAFVTAVFNFKKDKLPRRVIARRSLKNIDNFQEDLASIDWNMTELVGDIKTMLSRFNHNIITLYDKHAPIKTHLIKDNSCPWITENIKLMMCVMCYLRDQAHIRHKNSPSMSKLSYYRQLKMSC
ncbi:hypothetical protein ACJJTC_011467 [Scirpophaga incertulas]